MTWAKSPLENRRPPRDLAIHVDDALSYRLYSASLLSSRSACPRKLNGCVPHSVLFILIYPSQHLKHCKARATVTES